jgi:hypothetical protein
MIQEIWNLEINKTALDRASWYSGIVSVFCNSYFSLFFPLLRERGFTPGN